jgi:hypothetical protein
MCQFFNNEVGIGVLILGREMNRFCYDTGVGLIPVSYSRPVRTA